MLTAGRLFGWEGAEVGSVYLNTPWTSEAGAEHGANQAGDIELALSGQPAGRARMNEIVPMHPGSVIELHRGYRPP